jgi:hypothetical protein
MARLGQGSPSTIGGSLSIGGPAVFVPAQVSATDQRTTSVEAGTAGQPSPLRYPWAARSTLAIPTCPGGEGLG